MKAVLTTRVDPSYDDLPEERYHFPRTYLNQMQKVVGDWVVYYEPRRSTRDGFGAGGRQAYFAIARLDRIEQDQSEPNRFYGLVSEYLEFDRAVPFQEGAKYYEPGLRKADGSTNKGSFGRSVRALDDAAYDAIFQAGFAHVLGKAERRRAEPDIAEDKLSLFAQFGEVAQAPFGPDADNEIFNRPVVQAVTARLFRDRAFSAVVKGAYGDRCAVTGIKIINGGGRSEVQAAHIQPVADHGPDGVRNGLALSGTVHWMFDRGLLSIDDDYKVLIAHGRVPDTITRLLLPDGRIRVPENPIQRPAPKFLNYHRQNVFKG